MLSISCQHAQWFRIRRVTRRWHSFQKNSSFDVSSAVGPCAQISLSRYPCPVTPTQLPLPSYSCPVIPAQLPMPRYLCPVTHAQLPIPSYPFPVTHAQLPMPSYPCPVSCAHATNVLSPLMLQQSDSSSTHDSHKCSSCV